MKHQTHTPGICSVCTVKIYDHLGMCICNACRDKLPPTFAAAPEMLEALRKALNEIETGTVSADFVRSEITKAIARAEGRDTEEKK